MDKTEKIKEPIHLSLEEAKELFKKYEAIAPFVITCMPMPIKKSSLVIPDKAKEEYNNEELQKVSYLGQQIISCKENDLVKEGDIVYPTIGVTPHFFIEKEIILNYCKPGLRKYRINVFYQHDFILKIKQE